MNGLFSAEGKALGFLNRFSDLVVLNLLTVLCCLPVVTAGAAVTALHYAVFKMARQEDAHMVRSYFHAFRENFRQATAAWLALLACGAVLYFDFYFVGHAAGGAPGLLVVFLFAAAFLVLGTSCYVFPALAYFQCPTVRLVKNAFRMAIAHLPYTVLLLFLGFVPIGLILLLPSHLAAVTFLDLVIGFSGCAYAGAFFYQRIFARYIPKEVQECEG